MTFTVLDLLRGLRHLRGIPILGAEGHHPDDWEGVQIRVGPDGHVDERASSHDGYNYARSVGNWGSDAGLQPLRDAAEALGARAENGWAPQTHLLVVCGGSRAGNAIGIPHIDRFTPRSPCPPDPTGADRRGQHRHVRDQPTLAQESLAGPGG